MIELKDLIKEPIVFSTSWEFDEASHFGKYKHYLYITGKGVYLYDYSILNKSYSYAFYPLSCGTVSLSGGLQYYSVTWNHIPFRFSLDSDGLEKAEKLYLAFVTAVNSI